MLSCSNKWYNQLKQLSMIIDHLCISLPKKFTSISHQLHISFDSDVRGFVTIWISKLTMQNNGFLNDYRKHWSTFVGNEPVYIKQIDWIPSSLCSNVCTKANGSVERNGEVSRFRGFEGLNIEHGQFNRGRMVESEFRKN